MDKQVNKQVRRQIDKYKSRLTNDRDEYKQHRYAEDCMEENSR